MLNVRDFGAVGGDLVLDTVGFAAWGEALSACGGVGYIPEGRYLLGAPVELFGPVSVFGDGPHRSILVGYGGNASNSGRGLAVDSMIGEPRAAGVGALAVGPLSLTLADASGVTVGQEAILWLGVDFRDPGLSELLLWNRVASVAGNVVTFCDPLPETVADPAPKGQQHQVYFPSKVAANVEIAGLGFERAGGNWGFNALGVRWARNAYVHDIAGKDVGFNLFTGIQLDGLVAERLRLDGSTHNAAFSTASGGFFNLWSVRNVSGRDLVGRGVGGVAMQMEGPLRNVAIDGLSLSLTGPTTFPLGVSVLGTPKGVTLRNAEFWSDRPRYAISGKLDGSENVQLHGNNLTMSDISRHSGPLVYNGAQAKARTSWYKEFPLLPNMSGHAPFELPTGWYASIRLSVSSVAGLTNVGFNAYGGSGASVLSQLVAGKLVEIQGPIGFTNLNPSDAGPFNYNPQGSFGKFMSLATNGSVPAGASARLEIDYFPVVA